MKWWPWAAVFLFCGCATGAAGDAEDQAIDIEQDIWTEVSAAPLESGPTVTFVAGPTSGVAPLNVYLDGTRSKAAPDGSWIAACRIDFGDGAFTDACWTHHVYAAGQWSAVFTATDNKGRSTSATMVITVSPPASTDAGTAPVDAGSPDAGSPDAGTEPPDAGTSPPDAGTPTAELRWFGSSQGIPWARGVSADEGGIIWAVNDSGIFTKRPQDTGFRKQAAVGQQTLGDWPYAICGGAPGQAYVGYVAPNGIPAFGGTPEQRLRGDLDRVSLDANGANRLDHHYFIVNSNDARYDEVRTVVSCVRQNDRSSPYYGELYIGSNHAVTRIRGNELADHRHVVFSDSNGSLVIGYNWATALAPNGNLFFANEYKFGILKPTSALMDWLSFSANPWVLDTYAPVLGPIEEADLWHAAAVTPNGRYWLGSWGKGLLWMTPSPRVYQIVAGTPDTRINALAPESDNSVWVGTHSNGLWRYNGSWTRFSLPSNRVHGLFLDTRTVPRTLYIATDQGIGVYQGP